MIPKIYLETTIVSYLGARPSRDLIVAAHQQLTYDWWTTRRQSMSMWKDPIVEEVRRIREEHAAKFDYDLRCIVEDVKERERRSDRELIPAPPPKLTKVASGSQS